MKKKECRYNPRHKFDTVKLQLEHESKCPDKNRRTDLKECPFTNRHILTIKQYEAHIKKCKFRPKITSTTTNKNESDNKNNSNSNGNGNSNSNNSKNNNVNDDLNDLENWGDENDNNNQKNNKDSKKKEEEKCFDFDGKEVTGDVFEEDDFIFKQCYV